ncbi:MAG: hypothetical protein ABFS32_15270 [Bacteroidota bacterium]
MKKKEVIDIAIKVLGLFIVFRAIESFENLYMIGTMFQGDTSNRSTLIAIVVSVIAAVVMLSVAYFLLFKSSKIVELIYREDDSEIPAMNLDFQRTLELSLLIFGLVIAIFRFVPFVQSVVMLTTHFVDDFGEPVIMVQERIISIVHYLLAYILITRPRGIAKWIVSRTDLVNRD